MDGRLSVVRRSKTSWYVVASLSLAMLTAGHALAAETIGGAIYRDLTGVGPLMTGETGVTVTITGTGGTPGTYTATTSGGQGMWQAEVPEGTYTITPTKEGKKFWHLVIPGGKPDLQASVTIVVNQGNSNGSIQFLASNVGGMIFKDPANPTTSGLSGVTVTLTPAVGDPNTVTTMATTTGVEGWWQIGVTPGVAYRVKPSMAGETFAHIGDDLDSVNVTPSTATLEANTTLQFRVVPKLAFTGQPGASYQAGQSITAQVTVQTTGGATFDTSSAPITLTLVPSATLYGTNPQNASAGVASFTDLTVRAPGTYRFHATSPGLIAADSNPFDITPAPPASLAFIASPGRTGANAILLPSPQVELRNSFGNRVTTDSTSKVAVTLVGSGTLTADSTTTVTVDQGLATFTNLKVGAPGSFPGQFQLTATAGSLPAVTSGSFEVFAPPVLTIEKSANADQVDPRSRVIYTISYANLGAGNATGTVIVERVPEHLVEPGDITGGGSYSGANRSITWTIGALAAGANGTVSFAGTVDSSLEGGGEIRNGDLTIDCDQTEAVQAAVQTVQVRDKQGPTITPVTPTAAQAHVGTGDFVKVQVTDTSGVDLGTVTITIDGVIVYDGSKETVGVYDTSVLSGVKVKGRCTRTPTAEATTYVFTFVPSKSTPFGYGKDVPVVVNATDKAGNVTSAYSYSFTTLARMFGRNTRVNSDTGVLIQDNPATAADATGNIWVVWDQTDAAGKTDIYFSLLPFGATAFQASAVVVAGATKASNPALAVDSGGVAYVVWQANDDQGHWAIYLSSSTDSGRTWSTPPFKISASDPANPSDQTAPAIVVAGTTPKSIYVAWQDNRGGPSNIWLRTFTGTWGLPEQITKETTNATDPTLVVGSAPAYPVYVAWTDARNVSTTGKDLWAASAGSGPWTNGALIDATGDQSNAAGASGGDIAPLVWVAGTGGQGEILYADVGGSPPFTSESVLDEANVIARMPAVAVFRDSDGFHNVFACWEDDRDVVNNAGTDIYFAESGSPFGVNVLVNDDAGNHAQTKPAIGADKAGNPYIVWVDDRGGNKDIYFASSALEVLETTVTTDAGTGTATVQVPTKPNLEIVIPQGTLPAGVAAADIRVSEIGSLPATTPVPTGGFGLYYDFEPSIPAFEKEQGVKIKIPVAAAAAGFSTYNVYYYDPATNQWHSDGIDNPARLLQGAGGSYYLEVTVHHFTTFGAGGVSSPPPSPGDSGGGGGCALTPWGQSDPLTYSLPFAAYVLVLLGITYIDSRRRRAGVERRPQ